MAEDRQVRVGDRGSEKGNHQAMTLKKSPGQSARGWACPDEYFDHYSKIHIPRSVREKVISCWSQCARCTGQGRSDVDAAGRRLLGQARPEDQTQRQKS